jgi:hypothetical protein
MVLLLPPWPVFAGGNVTMILSPSQFAAGDTLHVYFTVSEAGEATLTVLDASGTVCATLLDKAKVDAGANEHLWDGTSGGHALAPGDYTLCLAMKDKRVEMDVTILSKGGSVPSSEKTTSSPEAENPAAEAAPPTAVSLDLGTGMTPAVKSTYAAGTAHEACYWCTPMDIRNEAAVWAMLTAPVTVVKANNHKEPQKQQVVLREAPSDEAKGVGVITRTSQAVHVLETGDDGWSLVECYSSSFNDSKVKAWNLLVTGYIKTDLLTQKAVSQEYGIVIDKLTQELYLFKEGRLFSTLRISTGLYNDEQPFNETRSGEFLIVSRTGDIKSDRLVGSMALRYNGDDYIHEVPHQKNGDDTKNFETTEYKLGTRASHGCIRTQRLKNTEGVNMAWLWNNIELNTKLVIWEDYAGRLMETPGASTPLYYNPDGGSNYHSTASCPGIREEYLPLKGSFTYGELEGEAYQALSACFSCIPPRRPSEIAEINRMHQAESPGQPPQNLKQDT